VTGCLLPFIQSDYKVCVATLFLDKWEDDIHTPEMGTWESTGILETSKFDCKNQNTSH
jgi:hypothetical protein